MSAAAPTLAEVRAAIAAVLGDRAPAVHDDDDLLQLGMDSIQVMRLASQWRAAGIDISYAELIEHRTPEQWHALLVGKPAGGDPAADGPAVQPPPGAGSADESAPFDLAPMQLAYWVGRDDGQPLGGVGTQFYCEFDGEGVSPVRLEQAARAVISRQAMLRARFRDDGRQEILPASGWAGVTVHDLSALDEAAAAAEAGRIRARLCQRRMAAERGEVFDAQVSLLPCGRTRVHLMIEMLVCDAQSFQMLLSDLAAVYAAPASRLPPLGHSFRQYLAAKTSSQARHREQDRAWWQERVPELPGPPQLPLACQPAQLTRRTQARRCHTIAAADWRALAEHARAHSVLLSMVLATAFTEVVAAWSSSPSFLLNMPFYDRDASHPETAQLVGDFTNLVLVAADMSGEVPFASRVRQLQDRFHADLAHASYPGIEVMRDISRAGAPAGSPAPVVFTSAVNLGELFGEELRQALGDPGYTSSTTPQVWLDCQVTERGGGLFVNWDAVEELFPSGVLDGMFAAFRGLLGRLVAGGWGEPVGVLVPAGQLVVRAGVNATAGVVPAGVLHEGVFGWAWREPGRVALVWGERGECSFGELADRALRVAALLRSWGVQRGDLVGVSMRQGPDQVAAVLGVLAAGGVYVPVGVDQPVARRERICRLAGVRCVLTGVVELAGEQWPAGGPVVAVEEAWGLAPLPEMAAVGPDELAYVIYTSGSTGEPKGVEITHRSALNTVVDVRERFGVGAADRVLALSALDFDLSVFDLFGLLPAGGSVVLMGEEDRREAARWVELAVRWSVTVWNSVPALLDMALVAGEGRPGWGAALRVALVSGDWVGLDLPGRLRGQCPGCRLVALGGATEAAIWSNAFEVEQVAAHWRSVPYGFPLRNQMFRVVDERGRDCPDWVAGELWIGGLGVARGYRGDPERTAAQFVQAGGTCWYRTGDLGRYWPDGTLEFLGRRDFQVKVGGHRIELGEIEAALTAHPQVSAAVAVAVGKPAWRLAAVVTPGPAGPLPDGRQLREFCAQRLPGYMIPEPILVTGELPLTGNGKIDRTAVAALTTTGTPASEGYEPPRGSAETTLAQLWASLLAIPRISRHDNFFTLGGDSLLATRLVAQLRAAGFSGRLRDLFAQPGLAGFAATLSPEAGSAGEPGLRPDPARRHEPFPPTEVQRAYWIGRTSGFGLGGVASHWYWELDGEDVDLPRLEDAWNRLVQRHEMLRAVFDDDGNQCILPSVPPARIAVRQVPASAAGPALRWLREETSHRVADPGSWPLVEIRAVRYGTRTRLALSFDYIVLDALSIVIVLQELSTLYADPAAPLPPAGMSFRDYVLTAGPGGQERAAAERYWQERAAQLPPAPALPLACDPAGIRGPRFTRREAVLAPAEWAAFTGRARAHGVTAAATLATAYAEVLSAWSEQEELTLNLTLFERRDVHPEVNATVGDFTSLLLAAYQPRAGETFAEAVARYQEVIWSGMEHRAVSAIEVLRQRARQIGREAAMPVVFTSALGLPAALVDLELPFGQPVWGVSQTPQVWLDCQVTERGGGLFVNWDAVEELFPSGVLDGMFAAFRGLLGRLVAGGWGEPVGVLVPAGQLVVRAGVNATAGVVPAGVLHEGVFGWAWREPGRVALVWGERGECSFGELADRALRVAALLRSWGVQRGDLVGVSMRQGPDQVAAVLGVLAAGGVYVPVGVDQPVARRERICRLAGVRCVLTGVVELAGEQWPAGGPVVAVEEAWGLAPLPEMAAVGPDELAYVIYTSGSTGEPKGVEITHRSALNTVVDVRERFGVGAADRVLALSALDFDLSVFDLFGLLPAGGSVVLMGEEDRREAARWVELAVRWSVTVWNSVPALLDMALVAGEGRPGWGAALRVALVSGDWVGLDLPGRLRGQCPGCRLVALGGATEAAIWSNAFEVEQVAAHWRSVPYGFPLRNQMFRVVDERGRDCPDWVAGELWIGGLGVARGYRGDPERTAAQFVQAGGTCWYRTGDLGRYWPDGTLEFLGRRDFQVKVGGHRIELGEIEAALTAHPQVSAAVAVAVGKPAWRLAAVVTPGPAGPLPDGRQLREFCAQRLPGYMIPEPILVTGELPLTGNGKIDRTAVAALTTTGTPASEGYEPPRGSAETTLAQLWASLLAIPRISRHDNFFTLGGDSLLATRLVEAIRRQTPAPVSLRLLLSAPTLAELASAVTAAAAAPEAGLVEEGVL